MLFSVARLHVVVERTFNMLVMCVVLERGGRSEECSMADGIQGLIPPLLRHWL